MPNPPSHNTTAVPGGRRGFVGYLGQQDRIVVATIKGGETLPGKKGENRERIERNVNTRKGGSLAIIVCRKAVVETV